MTAQSPKRSIAAAATFVLFGLTGCGLGAGPSTGEVTLTVTRDFGRTVLGRSSDESAPGSETAMRQLERSHSVSTSFGGRFVQSIDGLTGGTSAGRPVDWFYFVNGIEAPVGAAETPLRRGDSVWWDHRDWGQATHVPAVVGQWPHPFTTGLNGKKLAVRLICGPARGQACDRVEEILSGISVPSARGVPGVAGRGSGLRVLIGTLSEIAADPAVRLIEAGPGASGVYARPNRSGSEITLLDARGRAVSRWGSGSGLIAATVTEGGDPTWVVAGTDSEGLSVAIRALDGASLRGKYAAIISSDGKAHAAPAQGGK